MYPEVNRRLNRPISKVSFKQDGETMLGLWIILEASKDQLPKIGEQMRHLKLTYVPGKLLTFTIWKVPTNYHQ